MRNVNWCVTKRENGSSQVSQRGEIQFLGIRMSWHRVSPGTCRCLVAQDEAKRYLELTCDSPTHSIPFLLSLHILYGADILETHAEQALRSIGFQVGVPYVLELWIFKANPGFANFL